jgi:hypothetical protein
MPETKSTTIRFSEDVYRRLEAAGVLTGLPINSIVVFACLEWLERHGPERLTAPLPENVETFRRLRPGPLRSRVPWTWFAGRRAAGGPQPFDLFSEPARKALELAQQDARERRHGYIGTEHLLEGLVRVEEGNAAKVLNALSIGVDDLRRRLDEVVRPEPAVEPGDQPQPTKRVKKVIEIAFEETKRLSSGYLGTEHLLLGILIEGEGVAAHALRESGVSEQPVRDELERLVDEGSGEA